MASNEFPSRETVNRLRTEYPEGTRVELISMDDRYSRLQPGDRGTVTMVDDIGTIFVRWDSGSGLGVVFGVDRIRKLPSTITKDLIDAGIKSGTVQFVVDPNMDHGTVCKIGDAWFYFGGLAAEEANPDDYIRNTPREDVVREIYDVLEDFRSSAEFEDEYMYYLSVLTSAAK